MNISRHLCCGLLWIFAPVLTVTMACGDGARPSAAAGESLGSVQHELRSRHRHPRPEARDLRRRHRSRRDERLEALVSRARGHRHDGVAHAAEPSGEELPPDGPPAALDGGALDPMIDASGGQTPGSDALYDAGSDGASSGGSAGTSGTAGGPAEPPPEMPQDRVARSALPIYALEGDHRLSEEELWRRIAASPAVCFGEDHTIPEHHYAETRGQAELVARSIGRSVAFGFEMFERRFQPSVDAFGRGAASEEQLLLDTEYRSRWGYDYALYRPLVERARDYAAPILALNARLEIVRKIARTGLASLVPDEQAQLPGLVLDDREHLDFIFGLFGVLPEHAAEFGLENVYVAQTTWDETMADTAASWLLQSPPDSRVMLFAGSVHCHESAIPRRLTRRTGLATLSLSTVLESELEGSFREGYDLRVVLDDSPDAASSEAMSPDATQ